MAYQLDPFTSAQFEWGKSREWFRDLNLRWYAVAIIQEYTKAVAFPSFYDGLPASAPWDTVDRLRAKAPNVLAANNRGVTGDDSALLTQFRDDCQTF